MVLRIGQLLELTSVALFMKESVLVVRILQGKAPLYRPPTKRGVITMTIFLELRCSKGLRAHPIKDQWIMSGNSRILHVLSEDVMTVNVFGVLRNLDPEVWFVSFLQNACHFSREQFPSLHESEN
jgi:hypothetical protein